MIPVDEAWSMFNQKDTYKIQEEIKEITLKKNIPKCSDIYISTMTKIAYLNEHIDLIEIFWKIPVIPYHIRSCGVIKKQMKISSTSEEEIKQLENRVNDEDIENINVCLDIIKQVKGSKKIKFKDIRKINIGLSRKDIISIRKKKKGAFYNCFVIIIRVLHKSVFKEINIKVFNTGKLEIPGIREEAVLFKALNILIETLQPFHSNHLYYEKDNIRTVLINSNFSSNYYIDRNKFYTILKYNYHINVIFDACSYPGIQCKFYYNKDNKENNGICYCNNKCSKKGTGEGDGECKEISFMIFRTGSILIVGNCTKKILYIIYKFLKKILKTEYANIKTDYALKPTISAKKKRLRKKQILIRK